MEHKKVKDLMVPLLEYPKVKTDASLLEAVKVLHEARKKSPHGRQPFQAILVVDSNDNIIGKIGQAAILKSLEPESHVTDDLSTLNRAGVSSEDLDRAMGHYRILQQDLIDLCASAGNIKVSNVMHPVTDHIDEETSVCEAIHKIVLKQTLSLLVTRDSVPVGLIRLSDMCDEAINYMISLESEDTPRNQDEQHG
ncbi:MAG: CBS domain-containing protein [bacterium]